MGAKLFKKIKHPDQLKNNEKTKNILTLSNKQNVLQNVPPGINSSKVGSPSIGKNFDNEKNLKKSKISKDEGNNDDEVSDITHNEKEFKRSIEKTNSNKSIDNNNSSKKSNDNKCSHKNSITPLVNVNANAKNRCCSHYCESYMQALKGSRRVVECSEDGHSYACLSIPGNQTVTYTFTLTIPENVLSSLPPTDPSVCVENVRIILRTEIQSKVDNKGIVSMEDEELHSDKKSQRDIQNRVEVEGKEDGSKNKNENESETGGNVYMIDKNESHIVLLNEKSTSEIDNTTVVCDDSLDYREVILEISPLSGEFRKALEDRSASKKETKEKEKNGLETSSSSGANFSLSKESSVLCVFMIVKFTVF